MNCVLSGRDWVSESQYRQSPFNRDTPILLSGTCSHRQGGFSGSVNPLCPSRVPPGSYRALWHSSFDNSGNRLKLSEFAAAQGSFGQSLFQSPRDALSPIFLAILGVRAKRELSDCTKLLALRLFDDCNNHISIETLLEAQEPCYYDPPAGELALFSGIHCASFSGIDETAASLVEAEGCDVNQIDCAGNTPLVVWAARNGHEGVVKILLGRGNVDLTKPGRNGQAPLSFAAENGNEGGGEIIAGTGRRHPW